MSQVNLASSSSSQAAQVNMPSPQDHGSTISEILQKNIGHVENSSVKLSQPSAAESSKRRCIDKQILRADTNAICLKHREMEKEHKEKAF